MLAASSDFSCAAKGTTNPASKQSDSGTSKSAHSFYVAQSDTPGKFLVWGVPLATHADPDIPFLKQAKVEYEKLK
jgi:hypothetical protein